MLRLKRRERFSMHRKLKIDRAREIGHTIATRKLKEFLENFPLCDIGIIPDYVEDQMRLNFGRHFPVKQKYVDAAVEAARKVVGLSS